MPPIRQGLTFYATLLRIDLAYATEAQAAGCPFCAGRLHFARYGRKPRAPVALGPEYRVRQDGCSRGRGW